MMLFPAISHSSDSSLSQALTIDPSAPSFKEYPFNQEDDLEPRTSDFSILNQIFMSNEEGERWATITLKNLSTGQRIFSNDQLIAVFANGEKRYPGKIELKLQGAEAATHTFYFGRHKFPVLYVYVKN